MREKACYGDTGELFAAITAARGLMPADLVIKQASYLDVFSGKFLSGDVAIMGKKIVGVGEGYEGRQVIDGQGLVVVPGFIDAHVHIESSMMTPARFQESVLPNGTTSVIWDPHEIANVKGVPGIEWALESTNKLDLDVFVMVPSCVPSTSPAAELESSGANLTYRDIAAFKDHPRVLGLAEMMNFPGLLNGDPDVLAKVHGFQELRRDGHCPSLSGKDLNAYGAAGIHSCHESTSLHEAAEKLSKGIHVLIREGSCAKDAGALLPILNAYTSSVVSLCSDDRNPLDIEDEGHLLFTVNMALKEGIPPEVIFRAASYAAASSYHLKDRGAIAPGYNADLVLVKLRRHAAWSSGVDVVQVIKSGRVVEAKILSKVKDEAAFATTKNIHTTELQLNDVAIKARAGSQQKVRVIGVIPGQIVTRHLEELMRVDADGLLSQDLDRDLLKIAVFERHRGTGAKAVAFVQGFGLRHGAIATSINHDSHNIICVGASDAAMVAAVNRLIEIDGGIVVCDAALRTQELRLPVGGLMTPVPPHEVAEILRKLKKSTSELGCKLVEPFLTLSFLALPVIPSLKITDQGLIDVEAFKPVPLLVSSGLRTGLLEIDKVSPILQF